MRERLEALAGVNCWRLVARGRKRWSRLELKLLVPPIIATPTADIRRQSD